jgi:DNA-binding MarR family transcriptional regulator
MPYEAGGLKSIYRVQARAYEQTPGPLGTLSVRCGRSDWRLTLHAYACNNSAMKLQWLPCYCATLRQAARAATVLYEEVLRDSGLHVTQYTALQVLERGPELMTTELAQLIGIDQTTATRTLALIKKSGLATDSVGDDRRERRWRLTAKGQAQLRKLNPRWEAAQEAFEKRLGRSQAAALKAAAYLAASKLASN